MEKQEATPSNIFLNYPHDGKIIWGIVLPKQHFVRLYEEEKGKWPAGEEETGKITDKFGHLPISINGIPEPSSWSGDDKQIILPSSYFLENPKFFGGRVFGDVQFCWINGPIRNMGIEVFRNYSTNFFDIKQLDFIEQIRDASKKEFGCQRCHSRIGAEHEMEVTRKYFSGEYKGQDLKFIEGNTNRFVKNLVRILRECEFPENQ